MPKASTQPARGMRDFLPGDVRRRRFVIETIASVYERYGFEPLETPAVENLETLLGKYGEEGNQLVFRILKRGRAAARSKAPAGGGQAEFADLALRYDLTVPLARVVAEHRDAAAVLQALPDSAGVARRSAGARPLPRVLPVRRRRRSARPRRWSRRSCAPRQPTRCARSASPTSRSGSTTAQLLTALLEHRRRAGATSTADALVALDKLGQDRPDEVVAAWSCAASRRRRRTRDRPAPDDSSSPACRRRPAPTRSRAARARSAMHAGGSAALDEPGARSCALAAAHAGRGTLQLDPSLARGLSYYTGAIMEIAVPDLAGSLGGGGRYDNLVGMFLGQQVPACGFSLGLERILVVMGERGMFPADARAAAAADVMVAAMERRRPQADAWRWRASCGRRAPDGARPAGRALSRGRQARQAVQVRRDARGAASPRWSARTRPRAGHGDAEGPAEPRPGDRAPGRCAGRDPAPPRRRGGPLTHRVRANVDY